MLDIVYRKIELACYGMFKKSKDMKTIKSKYIDNLENA